MDLHSETDQNSTQLYVHLFTMSTKDPAVYSLPSRALLRLHFRLAKSLHLFYIEDRIAEGWPSPPLSMPSTFRAFQ